MSGDWPFGNLQPMRYAAIVADPPWSFENYSEKGERKNAKRHYDCMTVAEIAALPVGHLAAGDAVLFLWVTDPLLLESDAYARTLGRVADSSRSPVGDVIRAWGFTYATRAFVWVKRTAHGKLHMGPGYYTRANPEDCWLCTTGHPKRTSAGVRRLVETFEKHGSECLDSPLREHSRKPDEILARIEQLVPGPYCELFSRTDRPGWDCWGNEAGLFDGAA